MTYQAQDNGVMAAAELITDRGLDGLGDAVSMLINEAMRLERAHHLDAAPTSAARNAAAMPTVSSPRRSERAWASLI